MTALNFPSFLASLLAFAFIGCSSVNHNPEQQKEVLHQSNDLMRAYYQGDLDHARQSLKQNAELLENACVLEPVGRASLLEMVYLHLYVLEQRAGRDADADASLAKYWSVKQSESLGLSGEQAMELLKQLTRERIFEYVDDFDKKHNDGKQPEYLKRMR